jgi:15-cis-phytoene synthase
VVVVSGLWRAAPRGRATPAPHATFDAVAQSSAGVVIGAYSTSFGLATRLLAQPVRDHVRSVYALVRVADELVDAPRPGQDAAARAGLLATLETETATALASGSSSNLVVHAFARTARAVGIDADLVDPFFASMRADLDPQQHDDASLSRYVHGSAEVVGLMCLRAFLADEPDREARYEALAPGAQRLGAAFQKVNFVRDLADDADLLDRHYLPGTEPADLDDARRDELLDDVDADLAAAALVVPSLPRGSRLAVCAAHDLFAALSTRLRATPAAELRQRRVRVPTPAKAALVARAVARRGRPSPPSPPSAQRG